MSGLKKLYFGWTAYFKEPWNQAALPESVKALYASDGIQLLSGHAEKEKAMLILEAPGDKAPQWITGRLKGRLSHFLRNEHVKHPPVTGGAMIWWCMWWW